MYPVEYFYDWVYHLNREGRRIRTTRVIDDVLAALAGGDAAANANRP